MTAVADSPPLDGARLEAFVHQAVIDMGAAISGLLLHLGDRLGLYRAMAGAGPVTSAELAHRSGTAERYVREWLGNQAAGGYVVYDAADDTYELPPEHAMVLANEDSPVFMGGAFEVIASTYADADAFVEAFRTGAGVGWGDHDHRLFPRSTFDGFDFHEPSVVAARGAAERAGVGDRTRFEVAAADTFDGTGYDLVCVFDSLHDMGDPVGAARRIREALAPDGTLMLVEPMAGNAVEDNLNPVGRVYYGLSTVICTPNSLSQDVALGLGAQAGEARLTAVLREAGFGSVRRATETPFNLVLEARP